MNVVYIKGVYYVQKKQIQKGGGESVFLIYYYLFLKREVYN